MSPLRLINVQGLAGLIVSIGVGMLLLIQKGETAHWKKQSGQFEQLYTNEQAKLAGTVADYRAAADQARTLDRTNAARVAAEQSAINERTSNDYEARLAAARSLALRLRRQAASAAADPRNGADAPVPGLPAAPGRSPQIADEDRLSGTDALIATEQSIQLDELIRWVKAQAAVDPNRGADVESARRTR